MEKADTGDSENKLEGLMKDFKGIVRSSRSRDGADSTSWRLPVRLSGPGNNQVDGWAFYRVALID